MVNGRIMRCVACLAAVFAAAYCTYSIEALRRDTHFTLFYAAVALGTWLCGARPGLLAAGTSLLTGWYLFVPPVHSFVLDRDAVISLICFGSTLFTIWLAITVVHRAGRRRREDAEWTERTLEFLSDGVITTDIGGTVRFMNPRAAELTGWPVVEAVGRPLWELFRIVNEEGRAPLESQAAQALREGFVGTLRPCWLLRRDNTSVLIEEQAAAIVSDGKLSGAVLVFREVIPPAR